MDGEDWRLRLIDGVKGLGICALSPEGFITSWNSGAELIKGYKADEIIGQHYSCFFSHAEQLAGQPQSALRIAAEQGEYKTEGWRIRKDGARFWASVILNAIFNDGGDLIGYAKITRDCTEERGASEAMLKSERTFRMLVQGVVDYAIYMLDKDGRVASWNAGAERAKGYKAEEIIGRHFSCFYPPELQAAGKPAMALDKALKTGTFEDEGWRIRKDGSRFWAMVVMDPVYDDDGELLGFAKITKDCTERIETERSKENFRLLVQGVTDYAIYMLDPEGLVTNWNAGAERAKGYEEAEILGKHFSIFYDIEDREAGMPELALEKAREEGRFEAEGRRYRKDGTSFWANVVIDPIYDDGQLIGYAKITRDITQQKADQDKLSQALDEARAANVAKSAFLANMSHEIRTPMNGVLGMSELLLDSDLTGRQRTYVETISNSGNALLTIINDILDFSKIESQKMELDPHPFDLRAAVEDVATLLDAKSQEKGVEILVRCDTDLPPRLVGDAGRIRQIVTNLVGNAVKFTHQGHILINVSKTAAKDDSSRWRISVTDTGIGVEAEKLEVIFQEFAQAEETTTRHFGGTGLGLAISKRLTGLMGGDIGVESQIGKGSTFWIEIPLAIDTSDISTPLGLRVLPHARVLLVDDTPVNLQILEEQCRSWSLEPDCAAGGKEAIEMLERAEKRGEPYDAVLLDYHMPEIDGLEVARHVHRNPALSRVRIVVLSSGDNDESIAKFRSAGASSYLVKPVRSEKLYRCLSESLCDDSSPAPSGIAKAKTEPSKVKNGDGKSNYRILIAEDNEINRMVISNFLTDEPYDLVMAEDGEAAVEAYRQGGFDIVLMDLSMPKLDGFGATSHIRAIEEQNDAPRTPVICITAHAEAGQRDNVIAAGMDDFLTKPVKKDMLSQKIKSWLPDREKQQQSA